MKISFARRAVLCVVLVFVLLLLSCADSAVTDSPSPFDLSLGQYIGNKSYEEMLDILKLDRETANFEAMVLSLDDVDYDGTPFDKSLRFSADDNYNSTFDSIMYSHIFDLGETTEATVMQLLEKIYTELGTRFGGEPSADENGAQPFEDIIADVLTGEGFRSGTARWTVNDAGCEVMLSCQWLDLEPPHRYRITVVECATQDD